MYGAKEHIENREKIWFIAGYIFLGVILISSVVLYWFETLPTIIRFVWKYLFFIAIFLKIRVSHYEYFIMEKMIPEELEDSNPKDIFAIGIIISTIFTLPALYMSFKVAFSDII
jgi:hypothetical protein